MKLLGFCDTTTSKKEFEKMGAGRPSRGTPGARKATNSAAKCSEVSFKLNGMPHIQLHAVNLSLP